MSVAGVPTRKIKKALSEHGYVKDRCNDGHEIWEKQVTKSVSIPIHSKEINGAMAKRLNKEHNLDLF
ncbi:type II toxin-antitoxin system HicA family toxin [uncultured Eubacterium sp.]|uniref:type II toxin-antitoxin system HicA family toxin n=1 Tax=uncultured Eubacterium sp. TaxID=165185 RepID=UPI00262C5FDF|nr:type II toxin-antitoxin system HicA family toxin [uncultured Eubacterium sp.]